MSEHAGKYGTEDESNIYTIVTEVDNPEKGNKAKYSKNKTSVGSVASYDTRP